MADTTGPIHRFRSPLSVRNRDKKKKVIGISKVLPNFLLCCRECKLGRILAREGVRSLLMVTLSFPLMVGEDEKWTPPLPGPQLGPRQPLRMQFPSRIGNKH